MIIYPDSYSDLDDEQHWLLQHWLPGDEGGVLGRGGHTTCHCSSGNYRSGYFFRFWNHLNKRCCPADLLHGYMILHSYLQPRYQGFTFRFKGEICLTRFKWRTNKMRFTDTNIENLLLSNYSFALCFHFFWKLNTLRHICHMACLWRSISMVENTELVLYAQVQGTTGCVKLLVLNIINSKISKRFDWFWFSWKAWLSLGSI